MGRIKKPKKIKVKKRLLTPLKNKLKKLVATAVKVRDEYICQKCYKDLSCTSRDCHASHVIPTSQSLFLRYDIKNLKTLCSHCHLHWWHKDILAARDWFANKFPDRHEYLEERRYVMVKYTPDDYDEMIKEMENGK